MRIKKIQNPDYLSTWHAMQAFTAARTPETPDEIWWVEHSPVFTLGLAGLDSHLHQNPANIPVIRADRGGQITLHAPGQLVIYPLFDVFRKNLNTRQWVNFLEDILIEHLLLKNIEAHRQANAPGVYVRGQKIASLGLKIKQGRSYHGLALNINMDLTPFSWINPCGYAQLTMTQTTNENCPDSLEIWAELLTQSLAKKWENL